MKMTSSPRKRPAAFRLPAALLRSDRGATAVEYGLILALIVLGAFAAINGLGDVTVGMWDRVNNNIAEAM